MCGVRALFNLLYRFIKEVVRIVLRVLTAAQIWALETPLNLLRRTRGLEALERHWLIFLSGALLTGLLNVFMVILSLQEYGLDMIHIDG